MLWFRRVVKPVQGDVLNLLFVCSEYSLSSPADELIFFAHLSIEAVGAGVSSSALCALSTRPRPGTS